MCTRVNVFATTMYPWDLFRLFVSLRVSVSLVNISFLLYTSHLFFLFFLILLGLTYRIHKLWRWAVDSSTPTTCLPPYTYPSIRPSLHLHSFFLRRVLKRCATTLALVGLYHVLYMWLLAVACLTVRECNYNVM